MVTKVALTNWLYDWQIWTNIKISKFIQYLNATTLGIQKCPSESGMTWTWPETASYAPMQEYVVPIQMECFYLMSLLTIQNYKFTVKINVKMKYIQNYWIIQLFSYTQTLVLKSGV